MELYDLGKFRQILALSPVSEITLHVPERISLTLVIELLQTISLGGKLALEIALNYLPASKSTF